MKILFLIFCWILLAQEDYDIKQILEKINESEKKIESLIFDFKQEIHFKQSNIKQILTGEVIYQKPTKLKVTHNQPEKQVVLFSKGKIWLWRPDEKKVYVEEANIEKLIQKLPKGIFPITENYKKLEERFDFILTNEEDSFYIIDLLPKKAVNESTPSFKSEDINLHIRLWVDKKDFFPYKSELEMQDRFRISTQIKNLLINKKIKADIFNPNFPKDTEIIESK